jgi:hypothetical protein
MKKSPVVFGGFLFGSTRRTLLERGLLRMAGYLLHQKSGQMVYNNSGYF